MVIPGHNRHELIVRCLDSVAAQTVLPDRLIVVDNASTDNTRSEIEKWAQAHKDSRLEIRIADEARPGAPAARNRGLDSVDSEFVVFFDSDDVMRSYLIAELHRTIEANPDNDIYAWKSMVRCVSGRTYQRKFIGRDLWSSQIYHAFLSTQCYAVRTSVLVASGKWNENLPCWNDWELGIRLMLKGARVCGIDKVLADIYPQNESITGTDYSSRAGLWEKAIEASEADIKASDHKDVARFVDMMYYRRASLAALYRREGNNDLAAPLLANALRPYKGIRRFLLRTTYLLTSRGIRGAYLLWV